MQAYSAFHPFGVEKVSSKLQSGYVTDSKSETDGIRHFFQNLKSVGYLKSDHDGFKIFVLAQLYNYF